MLTFKSLPINNVDVWKKLLGSVLTFNLFAINDVDVVDLYMRIYHLHSTPPLANRKPSDGYSPSPSGRGPG
jgi:hypothetical protein